jgi:hypothetical protein
MPLAVALSYRSWQDQVADDLYGNNKEAQVMRLFRFERLRLHGLLRWLDGTLFAELPQQLSCCNIPHICPVIVGCSNTSAITANR